MSNKILTLLLALFAVTPLMAQETPPPFCSPEGCQATIAKTTYRQWPAYTLTNSFSHAVVVPAIGRVMSYGPANGENLLWNLAGTKSAGGGWQNFGGDKTWPAPQSQWPAWMGRKWPPDAAWDGQPHTAEVRSGGHLFTSSPVSEATGARVVREYYFDTNGDFVIEQTVEKRRGEPVDLAIWNITQTPVPDAVFVGIDTTSGYTDGLQSLLGPREALDITVMPPGLARIDFKNPAALKVGVATTRAALFALRGDIGFLMRAPRPAGDYPDDAGHGGFPVEVFRTGPQPQPYAELELLSPLRRFVAGGSWSHTVRWSWQRLPATDPSDERVIAAASKALGIKSR